jgi:hypothetical protein
MQFRALLLSVLCVVSGVSAQPNLLETAVAPVAVATKNIACTYVVGDVFGKVQKRVRVSTNALDWLKVFSKKEDFAQRIKSGENAAATELKLLFASNKSNALALMTPETDDSVVVQLIVDAQGAKKVVIYGFAPTCPEWIVALVDAAAIAAQKGWSLGKIGVGVVGVGVLGLALRSFRSRSSKRQVQAAVQAGPSTSDEQEKLRRDLDAAKAAVEEANASFSYKVGSGEELGSWQGVVGSIKAFSPSRVLKGLNPSYFPHVFNHRQEDCLRTAVHEAAMIGHKDALIFMAQKRANFNIQDNDGYTPAHYAAINNYRDSLQALRDGGANFNIQDNDGYTPAHYAAINNHRDSLQALRDGGANFNIQNDSGKTVNDLIAEKELV